MERARAWRWYHHQGFVLGLGIIEARRETRASLVQLLGAESWHDYKERRRALRAARRTEGVLLARWGVR